jgi:hypothetical protein
MWLLPPPRRDLEEEYVEVVGEEKQFPDRGKWRVKYGSKFDRLSMG